MDELKNALLEAAEATPSFGKMYPYLFSKAAPWGGSPIQGDRNIFDNFLEAARVASSLLYTLSPETINKTSMKLGPAGALIPREAEMPVPKIFGLPPETSLRIGRLPLENPQASEGRGAMIRIPFDIGKKGFWEKPDNADWLNMYVAMTPRR